MRKSSSVPRRTPSGMLRSVRRHSGAMSRNSTCELKRQLPQRLLMPLQSLRQNGPGSSSLTPEKRRQLRQHGRRCLGMPQSALFSAKEWHSSRQFSKRLKKLPCMPWRSGARPRRLQWKEQWRNGWRRSTYKQNVIRHGDWKLCCPRREEDRRPSVRSTRQLHNEGQFSKKRKRHLSMPRPWQSRKRSSVRRFPDASVSAMRWQKPGCSSEHAKLPKRRSKKQGRTLRRRNWQREKLRQSWRPLRKTTGVGAVKCVRRRRSGSKMKNNKRVQTPRRLKLRHIRGMLLQKKKDFMQKPGSERRKRLTQRCGNIGSL
mmetsp:Transcript_75621/g.149462  ORF Transcript_75621/g.149462 Transcript_75621/m.149462 type:complete len:315 (+) Transcript_75621:953-1897(+)